MVDEIERGLGHATAQTRGTEAAPVTAEGHQPALAAVLAGEHGEASAEQTTVEIALELAPYELGQRGRGEAVLYGGVERLQIFPHHPVQGAALRATPCVGVDLAAPT